MATSQFPNTFTGSGGGGGTPGGSDTQVQYNNAGSFGGITGATTNGTAMTLVAPVLGTPASGNLSNCTALPVGSISGLGTGVATFLATPSSANLASALTDETGTGANVFGTGPTLTGADGTTAVTITGGTQTGTSTPALSLTQTWNNGATTFTGLKVDVTSTASAAASLVLDLQVGSSPVFSITKAGAVLFPAVSTAGLGVSGTAPMINFPANYLIEFTGSLPGVIVYLKDNASAFGWRNTSTQLFSDASNSLDQRQGVNPQNYNLYGYYVNPRYTRGAHVTATATVTLSGASTATSNIIPVGSFVIGVATTTTTTITGASGYTVGDGSDADRWGDITGTAVGTSSDNTNSTANPTGYFAAASAVTLTAKTSNFTGGVVQVTAFYLTTGAD